MSSETAQKCTQQRSEGTQKGRRQTAAGWWAQRAHIHCGLQGSDSSTQSSCFVNAIAQFLFRTQCISGMGWET